MSGQRETTAAPAGTNARLSRGRFDPGDVIGGRYRVLGSLGAGRLDEAYRVEDLDAGSCVALKVLRRTRAPLSPSRHLRRLVTRLTRLLHPNVARVHELSAHLEPGASGEFVLFVTSELVEGETLGSHVRKARPLERELSMALIDGICSGLAATHRRGVVHGDLSSSAIILRDEDGVLCPVITDFALPLTEDRVDFASIGSPIYKAPETIVGRPPDKLSDVFSLGAVIYEILSGRIPFTGGHLLTLDFRRLEEEPRPIRDLVEDIDPRLERVVSRCLSRAPEDRYAHAGEVRRAIEGDNFPTPRTRRNVSTLSAAAALVIVMFGGSALLDRVSELEQQRRVAEIAISRPSFAIFDLSAVGAQTERWVAAALSDLIHHDFSKDGSVRVADTTLVRAYEGLSSTSLASVPEAEIASRIRTLFDVEAIVIGTCSSDATGDVPSVAIDVCVVDARSGEILASAFERGSPEELPELATRTVGRLRAAIGIRSAATSSSTWDPDAVRPWSTGLTLLEERRAREALRALEEAALAQPLNPWIQDGLTRAWIEVGAVKRASESARRAVESTKLDAPEQLLERRATLAMLEGDLPLAVEIRQRLARTFPDRIAHSYNLIDTLLLAGATRPAGEEIRRLRIARSTADPRTEIMEARLQSQLGRPDEAAIHARRGVVIAETSGSATLQAEAQIELARTEAARGDTDSALATLLAAESNLERSQNASGLARVASLRAGMHHRRGELDAAIAIYEDLRERYRSNGQEHAYATTLGSQATVFSLQGRHDEARAMLDQTISQFSRLEDDTNLVRSYGVSGGVLLALGRLDEASARFAAAEELARRHRLHSWEGFAQTHLGKVAIEQLDLDEADKRTEKASAIFESLSLSGSTAGLDLVRSNLDRLRGRLSDAERRLIGSDSEDRDPLDPERQADIYLARAAIAIASGRDTAALLLATRAERHYSSSGNIDREAECLTIAYRAAVAIGDEAPISAIGERLDDFATQLESLPRRLRVRLARAASLTGERARSERFAVYEQSAGLGLSLLRLEAAHELERGASSLRERDRWRREVAQMVRESGATLFLDARKN